MPWRLEGCRDTNQSAGRYKGWEGVIQQWTVCVWNMFTHHTAGRHRQEGEWAAGKGRAQSVVTPKGQGRHVLG